LKKLKTEGCKRSVDPVLIIFLRAVLKNKTATDGAVLKGFSKLYERIIFCRNKSAKIIPIPKNNFIY